MSVLLQIGITYPSEMKSGIGHVACTLGGVNYESRGSRGCLKGSAARGATHPLFRHHFFIQLTDAEAAAAKKYADSCVGLPYVWGAVPDGHHGGDCSGYQSGIYCKAKGKPLGRLFSTGTWKSRFAALGFHEGLGTGANTEFPDRPYPGFPIKRGSHKHGHVRWIQGRLNIFAHQHHPVLDGKALDVDGDFGPKTHKVVVAYQRGMGGQGTGIVGVRTWAHLNDVR